MMYVCVVMSNMLTVVTWVLRSEFSRYLWESKIFKSEFLCIIDVQI